MEHQQLIERAMHSLRLRKAALPRVKEERRNYNGDNAPVIELVNEIIKSAIQIKASDIHLEPVAAGLRCRFRIDGELREMYDSIPNELQGYVISRIKVMCGMDIAEHRVPQDGRFIYSVDDIEIDVRVSAIPLINGEKIVMRLLNDSRRFVKIKELEFSTENEVKFKRLIRSSYGAVIVAGPVNSGKTTTLYAALQELASGKENIMTIEDPVEYQMVGINQLQVNNKTGLTFAAGLRATLRQDSDLIMLGETRDEETAALAIRAALTGHLLFTTLHTASAAEGIFRLLDMGIKGYMLSSAVKGIVAQRLVRRLCKKCRKKVVLDKALAEEMKLDRDLDFSNGMTIYEAVGCSECNYSGYSGRIAIHEIMLMNEEIGQVLKQQECVDLKTISDIIKKTGMKNLWQDGIVKVQEGKTTVDELRRVLDNEFV